MSEIPKELIDTYSTAIYRVDAPNCVVTFHIDKASPELAELHREMGVQSSAFITAYHPYSVPVSDEENEKAQQALLAELHARGYRWLEGAGENAKGEWPAEPSVLVLGISEQEATRLAIQFRQNGYVFCSGNALPRLVLTR
jgi:hypothetical protein